MSRQCLQFLFTSLGQVLSKLNNNKADLFPVCTVPCSSSLLPRRCLVEGREAKPCQSSLQVLEAFLENVICDTVTSTGQAKRKTSGARDTACTMKHPPWIWESFSPCNRAAAQPRDVPQHFQKPHRMYHGVGKWLIRPCRTAPGAQPSATTSKKMSQVQRKVGCSPAPQNSSHP